MHPLQHSLQHVRPVGIARHLREVFQQRRRHRQEVAHLQLGEQLLYHLTAALVAGVGHLPPAHSLAEVLQRLEPLLPTQRLRMQLLLGLPEELQHIHLLFLRAMPVRMRIVLRSTLLTPARVYFLHAFFTVRISFLFHHRSREYFPARPAIPQPFNLILLHLGAAVPTLHARLRSPVLLKFSGSLTFLLRRHLFLFGQALLSRASPSSPVRSLVKFAPTR
mmetsp:Transcript_16371/g.27516  ORF Transcript_16371/g.27516 Transcript_16371/m.27516 type:complete len:220 (-) Transcript_16371:468-1127(-)